jgi:hypothetical protein
MELLMKTFKEYISEIYWVKPKPNKEQSEIGFQVGSSSHAHVNKQLKRLSDPKKFKSSLSKAKVINYNQNKIKNVDNTDAADKGAFKQLNKQKQKRVSNIFKKSRSVETPIILKHRETGHEHLLAGNTRATYGIQKRKKIKASVIEY